MYTLLHSADANILPFHNYSFCLTKCKTIKLLILKVSKLLEKSERQLWEKSNVHSWPVRKCQLPPLNAHQQPIHSSVLPADPQLCTSCWSYVNSRTQETKETADNKQNPNILVHQHHTLVKLFVSLCKGEATELADIFLHLRVLQQTSKSVRTCYVFMVPRDLV